MNQWILEHYLAVVRLVSMLPGGDGILRRLRFHHALILWLSRAAMASSGPRIVPVAVSAGVLLIVLWWAWSPRMFPDGDRFRVTFLDVGQGDSAVIELPDDRLFIAEGRPMNDSTGPWRWWVPFLWTGEFMCDDQLLAHIPNSIMLRSGWVVRH